MPRLPRPALPSLLDAAVVALVLAMRWAAQLRQAPGPDLPAMGGLPAWWWKVGSPQDWIVFGYDAEQWLYQTTTLLQGGLYRAWRPPLWPLSAAGLTPLFGDAAVAGHMLNHLLSAGACLLVYALGKTMGGRAVGLASALLMAASPQLLTAKETFSIDAAFQFIPVAVVLCCWMVARNGAAAWALLLAGVALAVAWLTHVFLGLYCMGAWGLLILARRGWSWRGVAWRAAAALLVPALCLALVKGTVLLTDTGGWERPAAMAQYLEHALSANFSGAPAAGDADQSIAQSLALALMRLPTDPMVLGGQAVQDFPWTWLKAAVLLLWLLGMVGPGLRGSAGSTGRWHWRPGLWLLVMQAPLFMSATAGPLGQRYGAVGIPFFIIAVARGSAAMGALAGRKLWPSGDALPRRLLPTLLALVLPLAVLPNWSSRWADSRLPHERLKAGVAQRQVARLIQHNFGPGDYLFAPSLDAIAAHTARFPCTPEACLERGQSGWPRCAREIVKKCTGLIRPGTGPRHGAIPALIRLPAPGTEAPPEEPEHPEDGQQARLDKLLDAHLDPVGQWIIDGERIRLYSLDPEWLASFSP